LSNRKQGTVKWFNTEKGYGFILSPEGEDVFVHYRAILVDGFKNLREGQEVSYLQVKSEKGWQAAEVELLDAPDVEDDYIEEGIPDDEYEEDEGDNIGNR
jgi:CspA family cold shock protein